MSSNRFDISISPTIDTAFNTIFDEYKNIQSKLDRLRYEHLVLKQDYDVIIQDNKELQNENFSLKQELSEIRASSKYKDIERGIRGMQSIRKAAVYGNKEIIKGI